MPGPYLFFRGVACARDGDFIEKGIANALRICYNPKRRKSAAEAGIIGAAQVSGGGCGCSGISNCGCSGIAAGDERR